MTIRSYTDNFAVVDSTKELSILPQAWTLLGDSGLFKDEFLSQAVVTFQETSGSLAVLKDTLRGSKPLTTSNDVRKIHSYSVPHFALNDALYPDDLAGKSAYGDSSQADTEAAAMLRKFSKLKKSYAVTKEVAAFHTLTTGTPYAPNSTISTQSFYTDFGLTRNEVDFVLGTATTDVVAKVESIIAGFQSSVTDGDVVTEVTAYCSPGFFAKLIAHAKIQQAYTYYSATEGQSIQRNRAGGMGLYRKFSFAGVNFIEVPTVLAGTTLIPANDAYFVANTDSGAFTRFYSPPNRFGLVNTTAMSEYVWTFKDQRGTEITIESESNFLHTLLKPNLVARGYTS